ncbi:tetratricopeptide repeat protein [Sporosarcina koreensis]|uniref:tetratricopeptide repeat protein n=1 Tax=Sporosarcina koreensis TaxID=334735 RepID=UPI00058CD938|nr:tetratricopeptide repeat protein [Sporosarcina koreensis]
MDKNQHQNTTNIIPFVPNGDFYYARALTEIQKEQFQEALKYLKRAAELSPSDPRILTQYGVMVMEEGRFDEALELLLQAFELAPQDADVVYYLAEVHAHLGMLREARLFAEQYTERAPSGELYEEAKEIIEFAEQEAAFLAEENPEDEEVLLLQEKARRMMESGEFDKAVGVLEDIIADYPESWTTYNNLALAYFYRGETADARELLYDILKNDKGNVHALCNLAVFYYYEGDQEKLMPLIDLLKKIRPYQFDHRYKLGATFALIGCHPEAYYWLRSIQRKGFEGDEGFFFWLSQAAFFSGRRKQAEEAFARLIELDPSKKGLEPWLDADLQKLEDDSSYVQDKQFLLEKIGNMYRSERMFGFFLLGKSIHKQEIIAHPAYIDVEKLSDLEKFVLAGSLDYQLVEDTAADKAFNRAMAATEYLYEQNRPLDRQGTHLFQMWFSLFEIGLEKQYPFKNPPAIAAAADYMFRSSRAKGITKTGISKQYGISTQTLTKYVGELFTFLPNFS